MSADCETSPLSTMTTTWRMTRAMAAPLISSAITQNRPVIIT
jgi:hypothetical protein